MLLSLVSNEQFAGLQAQVARVQDQTTWLDEALASGSRVRATDSATLSLASALQAEQASNDAATENVDGDMSLTRSADGGLDQVGQILQQMQSLATAAANGGLSADDRGFLDQSYQALGAQLQTLAQSTQYNGQPLLDGSLGTVALQVGTSATGAGQQALSLPTVTPTTLGLAGSSLSTQLGARQALTALGAAGGTLASAQATVGAAESALAVDRDSLDVSRIAAASAQARSADTDVFAATAQRAQNQILGRFQTALAAQANQAPARLLQLLDRPVPGE